MIRKDSKLIHWTPRVMGFCLGSFPILLAVDTIDSQSSFCMNLQIVVLHLLPAIFVSFIFIIACCQERLGGLLFLGISAVAYILFNKDSSIWIGVILTLPGWLTGMLFLADWSQQTRQNVSHR